jgi:Raf kinase inhibitor-like YbhB/YbcL family protein
MKERFHGSPILSCAVLLISFACARPDSSAQLSTAIPAQTAHANFQGENTMSFALTTTAFADGGGIPKKYTCDGADLSPALNWHDAPAGTQSFALIADDPDAPVGTWTHWIVWNIPGKTTALPEGIPKVGESGDGARQGKNDFKRLGYGGPCPPPGNAHRYFFKLYALDAKLDLKAGAGRSELEPAINGHVLAQTGLKGTYRR